MQSDVTKDNIVQNYSAPKILYNEIFFKYPGENIFHFNGKTTVVTAPTVGFIPKILDRSKVEYIINVKKSSRSVNMFFDCDEPFEANALFFDCSNVPDISVYFEKAMKEWTFQNVGYYAECKSYFYKIISLLQKHFSANYLPSRKYDIISESLKYIEKHYLDPDFDFEKLAEISGISYSYYKKLFTAKFNITPHRYINKLKLNYSCSLLKTNLYSVGEVAELAGYSSVYYFSHVFAKEFGVAPKTWSVQSAGISPPDTEPKYKKE